MKRQLIQLLHTFRPHVHAFTQHMHEFLSIVHALHDQGEGVCVLQLPLTLQDLA